MKPERIPRLTTAPTGSIAPFGLRMMPELRARIEESARANGRSMNAEILARLQETDEAPQPAGLTLRDYFAASALSGLVASPIPWRDLGFTPKNGVGVMENSAICAYEMADAMLKARTA